MRSKKERKLSVAIINYASSSAIFTISSVFVLPRFSFTIRTLHLFAPDCITWAANLPIKVIAKQIACPVIISLFSYLSQRTSFNATLNTPTVNDFFNKLKSPDRGFIFYY
jgi:hypothetical protein